MHDLHDHIAFRAVALTGGFHAAAIQLHQTPATVSRSVARLEEELGVRLLHRTNRSLCLTSEGRTYLDLAEPGILEIMAAREAVTNQNGQPTGAVRIQISSIAARTAVLPALPEFFAAYPGIELQIISSEIGLDMVKENIDVAVHFGQRQDSNYISLLLAKAPVYLIASPGYLERRGRPKKISDLADHNCINGEMPGGPIVWQFMRDEADPASNGTAIETVFPPKGNLFFVNNFSLAIDAALGGLGISVCDCISAWPMLERGELRIILPEYTVIGTEQDASELHISYPDRKFMPLRAKLVKDFIIDLWRSNKRRPFDPHRYT